jgi:alpha-1,2-mannosyltransferase
MVLGTIAIVLALSAAFFYLLSVPSLKLLGKIVGTSIQQRTASRRKVFLSRVASDRKAAEERNDLKEILGKSESKAARSDRQEPASQAEYDGIIGFLHPFCNAGGGGERVLWAAIRATQQKYPRATCVVYTGDHDVSKDQILSLVKQRFNIDLYAPSIIFLYLTTRQYVLASTWPRFTLLGQSLGSLAMAWDAFHLLVPDIFIDTMGYAFALALSSYLFPQIPTGAYVHYPTISTDMLASLDAETDRGVNAGAGKGLRGTVKRSYWQWFAYLYGWVGGSVDVVMTNSSWTQNHVRQLWGPTRLKSKQSTPLSVVFPPVAVAELVQDNPLTLESEQDRKPVLLYIAQFRPEKNHTLVLRSFANFLRKHNSAASSKETEQPLLLLIGSVRDAADEKYIYSLRLLAHELQITPSVTFVLNASWPTILLHLRTSSIGINAMWNEHFGIGVVEYQAAGLISVVNDSGGPKEDIVVEVDGLPTGFHASTEEDYAEGFVKAMALSTEEKVAMRKRARKSAARFGEDVFDERWLNALDKLVALTPDAKKEKKKQTT